MAIFRLNEDWSPFNRGAEFIGEGSGMYALKANPNVKAKIPAELLDEVDNGGYWKPKAHERYYFIDDGGAVDSDTFDPDVIYDNDRLLVGNCFRVEKDARAMADWLRARQRLIESGARFINSLDAVKPRYGVWYVQPGERLGVYCRISSNSDCLCDKGLCFDNEQQAEDSIKQCKEDWLVYLGVKEKSDDNS